VYKWYVEMWTDIGKLELYMCKKYRRCPSAGCVNDSNCVVIAERTMSQSFDRYSESVGHLVMSEDGAVTSVGCFCTVIF